MSHPTPEQIQEILNQYEQLARQVQELCNPGLVNQASLVNLLASQYSLQANLDPRVYDRHFDLASQTWTVWPGPMYHD